MKTFKVIILSIILTTFSCSKDDSDANLPEQGNIALALSNGAGYEVEDIVATVNKHYGQSDNIAITITGTTRSNGQLKITLIDNDDSLKAIANEIDINVGDTSKTFYATIEYEDDTFGDFIAGAGTVKINGYEEFGSKKYSVLKATFSAAGTNFKTMTSTIGSLVVKCTGC